MKLKEYFSLIKSDRRARNRFFLLVFTIMIVGDYLMFCLHTDKNPLAVFPPFPVRDERPVITLFVPDLDGTTLLEEKRRIQLSGSPAHDIPVMLSMIARGSLYENTKPAVPVRILPRQVWIHGTECIIDLTYLPADEEKSVIPGSEKLFKEAVTRSITANFPDIKSITIVNNGVYGIPLWKD